jgi:threonine dehydrogenase-like Zn-dependent dehydrogenase
MEAKGSTVCRRRRAGRPRGCSARAPTRRSSRADRRHEPGTACHARKVGFEPIDLTRHDRLGELVADVLGVPEVDCAIDYVGFEAKAQGADGETVEAPAVVLNSLMEITRAA